MNNHVMVRPEHLNHQGYLFGGALLKWVDEFAWIAASLDFPGCTLVTIGMDRIVFRHRVRCGTILRFAVAHLQTGTTSVTYNVNVFSDMPDAAEKEGIFSTTITFVRLDETGGKCALPAHRPFDGEKRSDF